MSKLNITVGRYIPGNSYLYRLDPRFKIIATIVLMVCAFLIPANSLNHLYVLLGFFGILVLITLTSRLQIISVIKGLQPIIFISLFTFVLQLIYNQNETLLYDANFHFSWLTILIAVAVLATYVLTKKYIRLKLLYFLALASLAIVGFLYIDVNTFNVGVFEIHSDGLIRGAFFFLRIVIIVLISTLLTISTNTIDINHGLEWLLHPLTWIKIPVSTFTMMLSLTLRFIPTLTLETEKIMNAQASRGIDFNEGNFMEKVRQITTLLVPIFALSITKADDLANAMEARGFVVGAKRTSIEELRFRFIDILGLLFMAMILAGVIVVRIML